MTPFRCPGCQAPLALTDGRCAACGWEAAGRGGVLNFVMDPALRAEAEHYEDEYAHTRIAAPDDIPALAQLWHGNPYAPFNETILEALGPLEGRSVLLLGNGTGAKELHLLAQRPRTLVYSDLSVNAVGLVRDHFASAADVWWAAIDGLDLPFADGSLDVVYGYAFVHHLPDVGRFIREVDRVLAPGGRAVFFDAAYSPAWQAAKHRWARPLMRLAHRRNPISDEDVRATLQGGYRREEIVAAVEAVGGEPRFAPWGLLHYLFARTGQIFARGRDPLRLGPPRWEGTRLRVGHPRILRGLAAADAWLSGHVPAVRENRLRLIWGFAKPAAGAASGCSSGAAGGSSTGTRA